MQPQDPKKTSKRMVTIDWTWGCDWSLQIKGRFDGEADGKELKYIQGELEEDSGHNIVSSETLRVTENGKYERKCS